MAAAVQMARLVKGQRMGLVVLITDIVEIKTITVYRLMDANRNSEPVVGSNSGSLCL